MQVKLASWLVYTYIGLHKDKPTGKNERAGAQGLEAIRVNRPKSTAKRLTTMVEYAKFSFW